MHTVRVPILALHVVIKSDLLRIDLFVKLLYTNRFRDAVKSKVCDRLLCLAISEVAA